MLVCRTDAPIKTRASTYGLRPIGEPGQGGQRPRSGAAEPHLPRSEAPDHRAERPSQPIVMAYVRLSPNTNSHFAGLKPAIVRLDPLRPICRSTHLHHDLSLHLSHPSISLYLFIIYRYIYKAVCLYVHSIPMLFSVWRGFLRSPPIPVLVSLFPFSYL